MRIKKHILLLVMLVVTTAASAQQGAGFPDWPFILRHSGNGLVNAVRNQMLDWKPSYLVTPPSSATVSVMNTQTSSDFGPSAAAYDGCGKVVFYVNHTGTFLPTAGAGLKIVSPSGTEITSSGNRMDASPMDNEVQVIRMPGYTDRWMIIYNQNFNPAIGAFTIAKSRYLMIKYSIVQYASSTLTYISKDVNLAPDIYYDYGKALSIEYNVELRGGTETRRYVYFKRASNNNQDPQNASTMQYDQYTIISSGFLTSGSSPRVISFQQAKGFNSVEDFGTPIELNETNGEIRIASMYCYNGTAGNTSTVGSRIFFAKFTNHESFASISAELIHCSDIALIPSDNTTDTWNLNYHVNSWGNNYKASKNFINTMALAEQTYISQFHRGLYFLEFSPNGRFVYVTGGGYSVANQSRITFLGQIDLGQKVTVNATSQYVVRLKVQEVNGFSLGANNYKYYGQGTGYAAITDAAYINHKGTSVLEKAPNSRIYFTKENSRELFCIKYPDLAFTSIDFLPTNILLGSSDNITVASDPTYTTNTTLFQILPDAVDQENYSVALAGCDVEIPCANCIGSFAPEANGTTVYMISTWVHDANYTTTPTMVTFTDPKLYIDFTSSSGTTSIGPFTGSGLIIDGWQRLENQFTVPIGTNTLSLRLECTTGDCYFDDIRVFPTDGSMKSYVYDPVTMRLMAELDDRNYATFFEYDEEGKLVRIKKETEKGIMTIQETKSTVKKF